MDHEVFQHHATAQAIEANPWSEVWGGDDRWGATTRNKGRCVDTRLICVLVF